LRHRVVRANTQPARTKNDASAIKNIVTVSLPQPPIQKYLTFLDQALASQTLVVSASKKKNVGRS